MGCENLLRFLKAGRSNYHNAAPPRPAASRTTTMTSKALQDLPNKKTRTVWLRGRIRKQSGRKDKNEDEIDTGGDEMMNRGGRAGPGLSFLPLYTGPI